MKTVQVHLIIGTILGVIRGTKKSVNILSKNLRSKPVPYLLIHIFKFLKRTNIEQ